MNQAALDEKRAEEALWLIELDCFTCSVSAAWPGLTSADRVKYLHQLFRDGCPRCRERANLQVMISPFRGAEAP
jgi:hypothetical protein